MTSTKINFVYDLFHVLPNDLGLRILGKQEILAKTQIWFQAQPSVQSSFYKESSDYRFRIVCRKICLSNLVWVLSFLTLSFFVIVCVKKTFFLWLIPVLYQVSVLINTLILIYLQNLSYNFNTNIDQAWSRNFPKLTVFCKSYLECFVQVKTGPSKALSGCVF